MAFATWAALFWAAQGQLLTKKKEERKGRNGKKKKEGERKEMKKEKRKKGRKLETDMGRLFRV